MILIFGANGQVGGALARTLGPDAVALGREGADLSRPETLPSVLDRHRPQIVINAAAHTYVDKAESERELAFALNAQAPGVMTRWCRDHGVPFVHYSTDYVFDGTGDIPWTEENAPHPLNVYGESKRAGEEAVREAGGAFLIFRTTWVYDARGKNFLTTMLRLGREKEELRVVADQQGAPTYAPHLAEATLEALAHARALPSFPSGIYHLCHADETSWYGFAEAIFDAARAHESLAVRRVIPITTLEFPTPACRPLNSRLNCDKAARVLSVRLPSWQEGLAACMKQRYAG